jgi:hypothetical protein
VSGNHLKLKFWRYPAKIFLNSASIFPDEFTNLTRDYSYKSDETRCNIGADIRSLSSWHKRTNLDSKYHNYDWTSANSFQGASDLVIYFIKSNAIISLKRCYFWWKNATRETANSIIAESRISHPIISYGWWIFLYFPMFANCILALSWYQCWAGRYDTFGEIGSHLLTIWSSPML